MKKYVRESIARFRKFSIEEKLKWLRMANKRFFDGNVDLVPKQAYTMGIKTIMQARKVLMVANGKGKAEIIKKAFFGPVTPEVPASILQMHPDFTLVGDEEALSLI